MQPHATVQNREPINFGAEEYDGERIRASAATLDELMAGMRQKSAPKPETSRSVRLPRTLLKARLQNVGRTNRCLSHAVATCYQTPLVLLMRAAERLSVNMLLAASATSIQQRDGFFECWCQCDALLSSHAPSLCWKVLYLTHM